MFCQGQATDEPGQGFAVEPSGVLQEKLYVHTDKTFYLAGETVWFKVYDVDAKYLKPLTASSIAYIEIISRDLKPVVQAKIALEKSMGNGSVTLPASLPSGNYLFRAYTSWMKNFPPEYYYEQTIHIVNTLRITLPSTGVRTSPSIQFFSEGGYSVAGLQGKIAFQALDSNGRGLDCSGVIINQQNDTVTKFQSLHRGMGNFLLKPEKNTNYFAIVSLQDTLIRQKLPDIEQQGYNLTVHETADKLLVTIGATSDFENTTVYLVTQTRQHVDNAQSGQIKNGSLNIEIPKKDLGAGVSMIDLFNSQRLPLCERLYFTKPDSNMDIRLTSDQTAYGLRKPVDLRLVTQFGGNQPAPGNLSVAVFLNDSLQHVPGQNILTWLYLSSELKGRVESPEWYFSGSATGEAMDNLLLTHGWRKFRWNADFDQSKTYFEFLPEIEGPVVNGRIVNRITGAPVSSAIEYISVPGADYAFNSATSDAHGVIHFGFKNIYKNNVLVVQPAQQKDSNNRIDITPAYSDKFSSYLLPSLSLSRDQQEALLTRSIVNQVENTYITSKKRIYAPYASDTTAFYGKPDKRFNLDEYTRFVTMEEVLREFVDDVRVRKEGDKYSLKVRNKLFNTYFEQDPLILLDGIPVYDPSKIIALDPLKIRMIEVVSHNYFIGSSSYAGIINVRSYSGDAGTTQIDPNALVLEYDGLQQQREFYSPEYASSEQQDSHIPDFRNLLYWAPKVRTDASGNAALHFYTSDLPGKYAMVAQGISDNGQAGVTVSFFEVQKTK